MKKYDAPLPVQKSPLAIWPYSWPSKKIKNGEYFIHYVAYAQNEAALHYVLKNNFDYSIKRQGKSFLDCVFSTQNDFLLSRNDVDLLEKAISDFLSFGFRDHKIININFLNQLFMQKPEIYNQSSKQAYSFFLKQTFYYPLTNLSFIPSVVNRYKKNYEQCLPYIKKMNPLTDAEFEQIHIENSYQISILKDLLCSLKSQHHDEMFFINLFNKLTRIKDFIEDKRHFLKPAMQFKPETLTKMHTTSGKEIYVIDKQFNATTQIEIMHIVEIIQDFVDYETYFNDLPGSHKIHWEKQFPFCGYCFLKYKIKTKTLLQEKNLIKI